MKKLALFLLMPLLVACATPQPLTPQEQNYIDQMFAFDQRVIPPAQIEECWGRAQSFVARYSTFKIQTVSDFIIDTYYTDAAGFGYAYNIVKTPVADGFEIQVTCRAANMWQKGPESQNARAAYYYIVTGREPPGRVVAR